MTVVRLLNYPVKIIRTVPTGEEDEWGSPVYATVEESTLCYYRWKDTTDAGDGGTALVQELEIILPADTDISYIDAVELDFAGRLEVIGAPDRALNARTGGVSHVKLTAKSGEL